jgi:hypothetical protein
MYDVLHSAAISVYMSCCKYPKQDELLDVWLTNKGSLLALLQQVTQLIIILYLRLLGLFFSWTNNLAQTAVNGGVGLRLFAI